MSNEFISQLKEIAHENEAALIIDEAGTGCGASGKGFWQSNTDADYVTFGKRTQVQGYFSAGRDDQADVRVGGSEIDVARFEIINKEINKQGLIEQVASVGKDMLTSVQKATQNNDKISGVRGVGTSLWIDTASPQDAKALTQHLARAGVLVRPNSIRGVMTKPALTLQSHQAQELATAIAKF